MANMGPTTDSLFKYDIKKVRDQKFWICTCILACIEILIIPISKEEWKVETYQNIKAVKKLMENEPNPYIYALMDWYKTIIGIKDRLKFPNKDFYKIMWRTKSLWGNSIAFVEFINNFLTDTVQQFLDDLKVI
jgi:hypothetical protein